MGLSATRFFRHWPEMQVEYDAISLHNAWMETYKHSGEQMVKPMFVADRLKAQGLDPKTPPGSFQMRPLVYKMLVKQLERLGVPISFNSRVVKYLEDEANEKALCWTDDGRCFEADVIIVADGIGSKSQEVVGGEVRARSSGRAMWRAALPIENLETNHKVKEFYCMLGPDGDQPVIRVFLGPGTYGLVLTRPSAIVWIINHDVCVPSSAY